VDVKVVELSGVEWSGEWRCNGEWRWSEVEWSGGGGVVVDVGVVEWSCGVVVDDLEWWTRTWLLGGVNRVELSGRDAVVSWSGGRVSECRWSGFELSEVRSCSGGVVEVQVRG
jgi:hypothetical protein